MKRLLILIALMASAACNGVSPDAGKEAVLLMQPCCFGSGGFVATPVTAGKTTWVALTTQEIEVDVMPQTFALQITDLMTRDNVPVDFQGAVRLRVNNSVDLVQKFGVDRWYERNVQAALLSMVRDAVKKRGMVEMVSDANAAHQVDREIEGALKQYITAQKIPVDVLDITLGAANPPDEVKRERNATAAQEQVTQREKQRKLTEDQRREAEMSRAAADNAYRQAMMLSPDQFLELERIKKWGEVCGGGKCTIFMGGGLVPTFGVK